MSVHSIQQPNNSKPNYNLLQVEPNAIKQL